MTLEELITYCKEHCEEIYVRAKVYDKWGNYSLATVPFSQAVDFILVWHVEGVTPPIVAIEISSLVCNCEMCRANRALGRLNENS